jgi:hypothetical protein
MAPIGSNAGLLVLADFGWEIFLLEQEILRFAMVGAPSVVGTTLAGYVRRVLAMDLAG